MKQALVISGGGSKGAFSVGVVKDLMETYKIDFDVLVGTSTGALIAPLAAVGDLHTLEDLYTNVTNDRIIKKYNFGQRVIDGAISIFTFGPLKEIIKTIYTDAFFQKLQASGKKIFLTTVCLQTEELVVFTTAKNHKASKYYKAIQLVNGEQFRAAVLASASQPVFTPPVRVNENVPGAANKDYQYVDGGVREYAGVMMAVDAGASEVFTVLHSSRNPIADPNQFQQIFPILQRTISMFITDVGVNDLYTPFQFNEALKYIQDVKENMKSMGVPQADIEKYFTLQGNAGVFQNLKPVRIHVIQPEQALGGGPGGLDFNPIEMREMLVSGRNALQSYVASLPPGDVIWA